MLCDAMHSPLARMIVCGLLLSACSSGGGPTPGALTAAPLSSSEASPIAPSGIAGVTPTVHPGDGVADPTGRIAFGRITRQDPLYGQVVALYAIDPDGSDLIQLNDGESGFPDWSPDGSRLAFTLGLDDGSWQIATMAPDGSDVRILTSGPGIHEVPSWSPDGTWIAYGYSPTLPNDEAFHTTIWRMDADGGNQEPLGDQDAFDVEPEISPDGTEVLFARLTLDGGGQKGSLYVRSVDTGAERALAAAGTAVEHPSWAADGASILYDISPAFGATLPNDQVMRIAADGSGEVVVLFRATADSGGFKPSESPDGSRIVFGCFENGATDGLCLMSADGSNVVVLEDTSRHENHFSWGPPVPAGG
jgi:Tol biopolymer transport system component